jgi:hypothetical protein
MVDIAGTLHDLLGGKAPAAVRRPLCSVDFGGNADKWKNALVSLSVESGMAPFVDVATLQVATGTIAPAVATADTGSIALGYEDSDEIPVFRGQVLTVRHALSGPRKVTAVNGAGKLAALRLNQSYEKQKAGDIVKDLAGRGQVSTQTIEDGADFPFYVVDDRQSLWRHIGVLAQKSGYLAYMTEEDELHFAPVASGDAVQTFTYGSDILAVELADDTALIGKVRTVGDGAAGSQGTDAWSWLLKDTSPVQGESGDGQPERLIVDPALRSSAAAQHAADALAQAAGFNRLAGRLLVAGAPAVTVGSTIAIADAPESTLNGNCLVRWLRHSYAKHTGFTTLILFSKTGGASGLLGSLGGLL